MRHDGAMGCGTPVVTNFSGLPARRAALGLGLAAAIAIAPRRAEAAANAAFQSVVANGADPTGGLDSSHAFMAAYAALPASGGTVYCPGGRYLLAKPLTFSGKPVQLIGDGSAATVLMMKHSGTCITYDSTINGILASRYPFQMRNLAIAGPVTGSPAACGVAVLFGASNLETGYQSCAMEDVAIGNALVNQPNGANVQVGLFLQNIWKSTFVNVRHFGAANCFVQLAATAGGLCIDNTFIDCFFDSTGTGFLLQSAAVNNAPIQGLNIINPKLLCGTAVTSRFNTSGNISVLGFFMSGGTIACTQVALDLFDIWTGFISDCSISTSSVAAAAVVEMTGCCFFGLNNCEISGAYNAHTGAGAGTFGVNIGGQLNRVSGIVFSNVLNGAQFVRGATSCTASGLQLVDNSSFPLLSAGPAAVDNSGLVQVGRNNAQWQNQTGNLVSLY